MKELLIAPPCLVVPMAINATAVAEWKVPQADDRLAPKCVEPTRIGDPDCWLRAKNQPNCLNLDNWHIQ